MTPPGAPRRLVALLVGLAACLALLLDAGGRLPGPTLVARRPWLAWAGPADPGAVVIGLVHALAVAGVAYLLSATLVEGAALLLRRRRASGPRAFVGLPWASSVVRRAAGLGLVISIGTAASVTTPAGAGGASTVVMHLEATTPTTAAPMMHLVAPAHGHRTVAPARAGASTPVGRSATPPAAGAWIIQPGDHLWKVAGQTLAGVWRHPPDDAAILAYVGEIVRLNADVFVVPGHPDLVYPGERFALPPIPVT